MNTIQPSFCKNLNKTNNKPNGNVYNRKINSSKSQNLNTNFAKANSDNYKANYMVNFKGSLSSEKSDISGVGTLNHQTAFFRELKTDEFVQNYILENFGKDKTINIVSGACSSGEEAKSYKMMLDILGDRLQILGFDISPEIVKQARNNEYELIKKDDNNLASEDILLTNNIAGLNRYERKCRNKFDEYFMQTTPLHKVALYPNAKRELENLDKLVNNKEEYEKQKAQYDEQMKKLAEESPIFEDTMTFDDALELARYQLEEQVKAFKTVADYQAPDNAFDNCHFCVGDITKLENIYEPDSVNVLLYRNALYHTLCIGDNMVRIMGDDAEDTMDLIAKQMNKVVKTNGLVVFGEEEWIQGIDLGVIQEVMENNGFELLNEEEFDNIWVKRQDV